MSEKTLPRQWYPKLGERYSVARKWGHRPDRRQGVPVRVVSVDHLHQTVDVEELPSIADFMYSDRWYETAIYAGVKWRNLREIDEQETDAA